MVDHRKKEETRECTLVGGDGAGEGALGEAEDLRAEAEGSAGGGGVGGAAEAGGEAEVVGDDLAGVERLEVQHDDRVHVQARLGLHHQWNCLHRRLVLCLRIAPQHIA